VLRRSDMDFDSKMLILLSIPFVMIAMIMILSFFAGENVEKIRKERYEQYNICLKNNHPKDVCREILFH